MRARNKLQVLDSLRYDSYGAMATDTMAAQIKIVAAITPPESNYGVKHASPLLGVLVATKGTPAA